MGGVVFVLPTPQSWEVGLDPWGTVTGQTRIVEEQYQEHGGASRKRGRLQWCFPETGTSAVVLPGNGDVCSGFPT